jgi:hypothetical protein
MITYICLPSYINVLYCHRLVIKGIDLVKEILISLKRMVIVQSTHADLFGD